MGQTAQSDNATFVVSPESLRSNFTRALCEAIGCRDLEIAMELIEDARSELVIDALADGCTASELHIPLWEILWMAYLAMAVREVSFEFAE